MKTHFRIAWAVLAIGFMIAATVPAIGQESRAAEKAPIGAWYGVGDSSDDDYVIIAIARGKVGEQPALWTEVQVGGCDNTPGVLLGTAVMDGTSVTLRGDLVCMNTGVVLLPDFEWSVEWDEEANTLTGPDNAYPDPFGLACGDDGTATITGTEKKDTLTGTEGNDVIDGLGGKDTIDGLGGHDIICGGRSRDTINGGDGIDVVMGGPGKDTINGGDGFDFLSGEEKGDTISGGDGDDYLIGGGRKDILVGDAGDDIADGGTDAAAQNSIERDQCDAETETYCEFEPGS